MSLVHRTPYRRLLEGKAKVGLAKARIVVPDGVAMAGYSLDGKVGRNAGDELWARALVVETLDGAERLAIVACDIMSASRALYEAALARLAGWAEASLIVCGTHTHTAPGRFYGNGFYDFFAQSLGDFPHFGFREDVCEAYADAVVGAVTAAWDGREAGTLAVGRVDLWGVARNRSYEAFEANYAGAGQHPRDWNEAADSPAPTPPAGLLPQGRASDPRLTTYAAWRDDGTLLGALGTFACHATALGPEHERYGRDWPGFAVGRAQAWLTPAGGETPLIAITGAAIGDQSPLPPDEPLPIDVDDHQGRGLARWVGYAVGEAVAASLEAAPTGTDPLTLRPRATRWAPAEDYGWDVGFATLAGAEDGRSFLAELCPRRVREGVRIRPGAGDPNDVQYPKRLALAPLQRLLKRTRLVIAPDHPVHYAELRAGNDAHAIFTVPGEPTVVASHRIERALLQGITASGRESASALACAGDYAGYVTTPEEYAEQHYEGASTLFGRETLPHLVGTLQALAAQNVIRSRSRTVVEPLRARDVLRDARGLPGRLARRPWLLDDDGRRELVVAGGIVPHLLARRGRVAATKTAKVPHLKVRIAAYDRSGLRRTSRLRKLEEPD